MWKAFWCSKQSVFDFYFRICFRSFLCFVLLSFSCMHLQVFCCFYFFCFIYQTDYVHAACYQCMLYYHPWNYRINERARLFLTLEFLPLPPLDDASILATSLPSLVVFPLAVQAVEGNKGCGEGLCGRGGGGRERVGRGSWLKYLACLSVNGGSELPPIDYFLSLEGNL